MIIFEYKLQDYVKNKFQSLGMFNYSLNVKFFVFIYVLSFIPIAYERCVDLLILLNLIFYVFSYFLFIFFINKDPNKVASLFIVDHLLVSCM